MSDVSPHHGPAPTYPPPYYPPAQPGPPQAPGTNGHAIAALIFGIVGAWPLGVIFGAMGLGQIRRTGQAGRGAAITGLVLSGIWALVSVVVIIVVIANAAGRDESGAIATAGDVSAESIRVGDCLNGLENGQVSSIPAVPCSSPHEGEAFAVFDLPDGPYPGQSEVDSQAQEKCAVRIAVYSPSAETDPTIGLFILSPSAETWPTGDREVACIAASKSGTTTGSIRGR
jgi:Septum formation/Domain of unknown function (DUF4190)